MADEREIQSGGRKDNAAQPLSAGEKKGGPERYPTVRQDDAVENPTSGGPGGEGRSFDPTKDASSQPPQGAGDTSKPPSKSERRLGSGGDPAEGKR